MRSKRRRLGRRGAPPQASHPRVRAQRLTCFSIRLWLRLLQVDAQGGRLAVAVSSPCVRAAVGAVLLLTGWGTAACGASGSSTAHTATVATSTRSSSALTTASSAPAPSSPSARRLEDALLANTGPPRLASASCRPATAAERTTAPFGQTARPVFVCLLAVEGHRDTFAVQVLKNGCYVAERTRPGQAIYGCGAGAAS